VHALGEWPPVAAFRVSFDYCTPRTNPTGSDKHARSAICLQQPSDASILRRELGTMVPDLQPIPLPKAFDNFSIFSNIRDANLQ
jgi:hypothetical protein